MSSQVTVEPGMVRKVTSLLEGLGGQVGQVQVGAAGRRGVKVTGLPGRGNSMAKAPVVTESRAKSLKAENRVVLLVLHSGLL